MTDTGTPLRAIYVGDQHLGCVLLAPIVAGTALVRIYLAPEVRAEFDLVLPALLPTLTALRPQLRFALWAPTPEWAALYRPLAATLGFVEHTLFVR